MYHWAIENCNDISAFVEANVKFVQSVESSQLASLQDKAHLYESEGLARWSFKLKEEIEELAMIPVDVKTFCQQIHEYVSGNYSSSKEPQRTGLTLCYAARSGMYSLSSQISK